MMLSMPDVDDGQVVRLEEERPSEKALIGKLAAIKEGQRIVISVDF